MNLNLGIGKHTTDKVSAFLRANAGEYVDDRALGIYRKLGRGETKLQPDQSFMILGAEQDGNIVGMSVVVLNGKGADKDTDYSVTVVEEAWRRKGLGRQLMQAKIGALAGLGRVLLTPVNDMNVAGLKLVRRHLENFNTVETPGDHGSIQIIRHYRSKIK